MKAAQRLAGSTRLRRDMRFYVQPPSPTAYLDIPVTMTAVLRGTFITAIGKVGWKAVGTSTIPSKAGGPGIPAHRFARNSERGGKEWTKSEHRVHLRKVRDIARRVFGNRFAIPTEREEKVTQEAA
jgi:hypothetical protein